MTIIKVTSLNHTRAETLNSITIDGIIVKCMFLEEIHENCEKNLNILSTLHWAREEGSPFNIGGVGQKWLGLS